MRTHKPDGWAESVDKYISEGKNFKDTRSLLLKEYGEEGTINDKTFWSHKQKINPSEEREAAIQNLTERTEAKKRPAWNKGKQKAADESPLAKLINKGIFALMPCPTKEL